MTAGMRLVTRQFHATVDQEQEEISFEVADAGVHYAFWLVNEANADPASLPATVVVREVTDPNTNKTVGRFFVTFSVTTIGGFYEITASSAGLDMSAQRWQYVDAKIQGYDSGGGAVGYYIKRWEHKS